MPQVATGSEHVVATRNGSAQVRSAGGSRSADLHQKWLVLGTLVGNHRGTLAPSSSTRHCASRRTFSSRCLRATGPAARERGRCSGVLALRATLGHTAHRVRGALAGAVLVFTVAPEARSRTDAAIAAVHHNPRDSSAHCLREDRGLGAHHRLRRLGRREGADGAISAGFGSVPRSVLNLSPRTLASRRERDRLRYRFGLRRFRSEAPYCHRDLVPRRLEVEALLPSFIASSWAIRYGGPSKGSVSLWYVGNTNSRAPCSWGWFGVIASRRMSDCFTPRASTAWPRSSVDSQFPAGSSGDRWPDRRVHRSLAIPEYSAPATDGFKLASELSSCTSHSGSMLILPVAAHRDEPALHWSGGSGGIFGPGMVIGAFRRQPRLAACWSHRARFSATTPPVRHCRDDGLLRSISRAPLAVDAHGRRDDGNALADRAGHAPRSGLATLHRAPQRRHLLSQPTAQSGRVPCAPYPHRFSTAAIATATGDGPGTMCAGEPGDSAKFQARWSTTRSALRRWSTRRVATLVLSRWRRWDSTGGAEAPSSKARRRHFRTIHESVHLDRSSIP